MTGKRLGSLQGGERPHDFQRPTSGVESYDEESSAETARLR
jgi:hypothetical protein